jgi:hypothetical protein
MAKMVKQWKSMDGERFGQEVQADEQNAVVFKLFLEKMNLEGFYKSQGDTSRNEFYGTDREFAEHVLKDLFEYMFQTTQVVVKRHNVAGKGTLTKLELKDV